MHAARVRSLCFLAIAACHGPVIAAPPAPSEWNFEATLDGKPIGWHRFSLEREGPGDGLRLTSEARFAVKVLGFTAFRYRHSAVEHWQGGCLSALRSNTDDDGKPAEVSYAPNGEGCVLSFAYWHPALRTQQQLLNAQTGRLEPVKVSSLGEGRIDVDGAPVAAQGWRIAGAASPIDVWYAADGRWVGLDSIVGGKRKLSYRLRGAAARAE